MSSLIVQKYGGTSMATAHSFKLVGERVARNNDARVIVVSAPGKITDSNDPSHAVPRDSVKATDALLRIAGKARWGEPLTDEIAGLKRRFTLIEEGLQMPADRCVSPLVETKVLERVKMLDDGN